MSEPTEHTVLEIRICFECGFCKTTQNIDILSLISVTGEVSNESMLRCPGCNTLGTSHFEKGGPEA